MGLLDRVSRVIRSNLNSMVGAAEDPEKILDQAIEDMQNDLVKMSRAVQDAIASQKRVQHQLNQTEAEVNKWHRWAELALQKGDENLAREALSRKKTNADTATALQNQIDTQYTQIESLKRNRTALESKISEAKTKRNMLKARASAAKASEQLQNTMSSIDTSSSMGAFERMEEKVLMMEAQSQAAAELTGSDLESQFAALESSDVDDELQAMKAQLSGGGYPEQGQLPASDSDTTNTQTDSNAVVDDELEELRAQLDKL